MKAGLFMEFRDLKKQYQILQKEIDSAVQNIFLHADFISGKEVSELEEALADYIGVKHCITCGNGTDALVLALWTWKIGAGDAVFVPDFTFFASGEAPAVCGATPIFVDVECDTFNLSPNALEKSIQQVIKKGQLIPKAVIAVDLFGQPANFPEIKDITEKYGLLLLEDGAQGFGGRIGEKMACSFGDISTTSFFPAKPLGCYGDGGALFTDNDEWAEIIRSLCIHGKGKNKYDNVRIGMNSRLDTIQAAILLVKLKAFQSYELDAVNQAAEWYAEELKDIVRIPTILPDFYSSYAQYTIVCKNLSERQHFQNCLKEQGIPSMIYYAKGLHEQNAFANCRTCREKYNNTDYLKDRVLSLPMHPYIERKEITEICNALKTED